MEKRIYVFLGLVEVREEFLMLPSSPVLMLQGLEVYPIQTLMVSLRL
jgi:hypothetical protein